MRINSKILDKNNVLFLLFFIIYLIKDTEFSLYQHTETNLEPELSACKRKNAQLNI